MGDSVEGRNIKLVVAYDGTAYHGWQRQAPGLPTVQGCIEAVLARLLGQAVAVNGAGRTDAGVHARGQVANVRTADRPIPIANLLRAANARLPDDIALVSAAEVPPAFHASRSALGKTYRYRIYLGPGKPVMRARRVYRFPRPLDVARMADAAARLVGRHDFRGLASSGDQRDNTVRTITRCELAEVADEVHVTVSGDGFLYKMVRNIVGTLVEIGRGRRAPERIDRLLATGERALSGPSAPPGGLCLMSVRYPPAALRMPAGSALRPGPAGSGCPPAGGPC